MAALYIDAQAAHDILKHTMKQLRAKVHLPLVPLATNFEYNFERPPRYNLDGRNSVSEIAGFPRVWPTDRRAERGKGFFHRFCTKPLKRA